MTMVLAALLAGALVALLHVRACWNAAVRAGTRGHAARRLARVLATAAALAVWARAGAGPLMAALAGFWAARTACLFRIGGRRAG